MKIASPLVVRSLFRPAGLFAAAVLILGFAGCARKPPLRTVAKVDMKRYVGDWYVFANIPYFAERDCYGSIESYHPRPDGRMDNQFTYRRGSWDAPVKQFRAIAWVYDTKTNAEWRVRFAPLITAKYFILDLDPNYRWAVVGHPSRKYGWVLTRGKTLPEATYRQILERLAAQGYDPAKFVKVPQIPPGTKKSAG